MDEKEKEILAELREQGKVPNTPEYMLYAMLGQAHPLFRERMEELAVRLKKSVQDMVETTQSADSREDLKEAFNQEIKNRAAGQSFRNNKSDDKNK